MGFITQPYQLKINETYFEWSRPEVSNGSHNVATNVPAAIYRIDVRAMVGVVNSGFSIKCLDGTISYDSGTMYLPKNGTSDFDIFEMSIKAALSGRVVINFEAGDFRHQHCTLSKIGEA